MNTHKDYLEHLVERLIEFKNREDIEDLASKLEDMVIALEIVTYKEYYLDLKSKTADYARLCLSKRKESRARVRDFNFKYIDFWGSIEDIEDNEERQKAIKNLELELQDLEKSYESDVKSVVEAYNELLRYYLDYGLNVGNVYSIIKNK